MPRIAAMSGAPPPSSDGMNRLNTFSVTSGLVTYRSCILALNQSVRPPDKALDPSAGVRRQQPPVAERQGPGFVGEYFGDHARPGTTPT